MDNNFTKLLYQIALTKIEGVGGVLARKLIDTFENEEDIFKSTKKVLTTVKGISATLADKILDCRVLKEAEKELVFVEDNKIKTYFYKNPDYPSRLNECVDAPVLLYFKGNANWSVKKVLSVVGTRKSTGYGSDFCNTFIDEIASLYPDMLIVSGLAYGIDVHAHKAALNSKLSTIGVLAHGLDRIYPPAHRKIAIEMLENGGLLSEFSSGTKPDKYNFVSRNRIVAGIADATIVVQSDKKGGSLITAELANSYNREVFAVPGRITDKESIGCNMLIEQNKAVLLQSAESFIKAMQWDIPTRSKPKQQELFIDLSHDEQRIYELLVSCGNVHINFISNQTGILMSSLLPLLLSMEMKGVTKSMGGNTYTLT